MKKKQSLFITIIIVIFFISLGYAYLTSNLLINGSTRIRNLNWDIYWDNVQVTTGSVTGENVVQEPTIDTNKTEVSYSIILTKPGDFYEFTVDAVNDGNMDAMVNMIISNMNGIYIENLPAYLEYNVSYEDGTKIRERDLLASNTSKKYKIHVGYKRDITSEELPEEDQELSFDFLVEYVQATSVAHEVISDKNCTYTGELTKGAVFIDGQYEYRYMQNVDGVYNPVTGEYPSEWVDIEQSAYAPYIEGWGVALRDLNSTAPVTTQVCTTIGGKPVISMSRMFYNSKTTSIDTSNFITSDVITMGAMFQNTPNIRTVDLNSFDTTNVYNMAYMFDNTGLSTLDVSNFDTGFVQRMPGMFSNINVPEIDLSNFNTRMVRETSTMFSDSNISNIIFPTDFDLEAAENMNYMFVGTQTNNLDLSTMKTKNVTDMLGFFSMLKANTLILPNNWDIHNVNSLQDMFNGTTITSNVVWPETIDTSNVRVMQTMFYRSNIKTIDLSGFVFDNVTDLGGFLQESQATTVTFPEVVNAQKVTTMGTMFFRSKVNEIDLSGFKTNNLTTMKDMFNTCAAKKITFSSDFKTQNVTNMNAAFYGVRLDYSLDISSFDVSSTTDVRQMFGQTTIPTVFVKNSTIRTILNNSSGNTATFVVK